MEKDFKQGDIVWAKMKGFPPWPAKIMQSSEKMDDIPAGRYSVLFFGTNETAIIKKCDLFDYNEYRDMYEVQRTKGFDEALKEARLAAGYPSEMKSSKIFERSSSITVERSLPGTSSNSSPKSSTGKYRKSNRSESNENKLEDFVTTATATARCSMKNRTPSQSPTKDVEIKNERKRLGSFSSSSGRRKTNSFSQTFGLDFGDDPMLPILNDGAFNSFLDGISANIDEASKSPVKNGRSAKSIIEDYISSGKLRERLNSASSTGRTSMSDAFDEFLGPSTPLFSPSDPLSSMSFNDILGTFEDRPTTSFDGKNADFRQQNPPQIYCSKCGCQCVLYGIKWRCTSSACLKWNGIFDPYNSAASALQLPDNAKEGSEDVKTNLVTTNVSPGTALRDSSLNNIHNSLISNSMSDYLAADSFSSIYDQTSVKIENELEQMSDYPHCTTEENNATESVLPTVSTQVGNDSLPNNQSPSKRTGNGRPKFYKVEKTPQVAEDGCRHCFYCNGQVRPQMCGGNRHRWRCVDKKCRKWYGWVRSHEEIPKDLGKKGRWKDLIKIRRKSPSFSELDEQGKVKKKTRKITRRSGCRFRATGSVQLRSCMERRVRWWTNEKRQSEPSPEREITSDPLNAAAVCVIISKSMFSATHTRADETGTVNGTLDLLMDTLFSSFAPLLSLTKQLPGILDQQIEETLWEACATHTPKFA